MNYKIFQIEYDLGDVMQETSKCWQEYASVGRETAASESDFSDVELNIANVELDGACSGHDFTDVGLDFTGSELNR